MEIYNTTGTCSKQIHFDVDKNGIIMSVKFVGGCNGNLQDISRLSTGKHIDEIIATLKGIKCRSNTSCGDQLAKALESIENQ